MSTLAVNAVTDANGGNTATINSMTPTADSLQGFRNRIINGDMRIAQRGTGAFTASGDFPVDRFFVNNATDGAFSAQQDSSAPVGFVNSVKLTTTTADASLGATQYYIFRHKIEGLNTADLMWGTANAKTITLSFWVRSSLTGTFGGVLANSGQGRIYPFTYTISAADTWEQKSLTIAGDTTGTWLTTNGTGIEVVFGLGVGTDYSGTAGSWSGTFALSATGATSVIGTLNATWFITGVQLEVGSVATPFERRPFGTELALCQRYFYGYISGNSRLVGRGGYFSGTQVEVAIFFPVTMRTTPTLVATSGTNYYVAFRNGGSDDLNSLSLSSEGSAASVSVFNNSEASGTAGNAAQIATNNASASVAFSAEL